jgi:hypothetical protein
MGERGARAVSGAPADGIAAARSSRARWRVSHSGGGGANAPLASITGEPEQPGQRASILA